jgi:hypothetical protein
MSVNETDICNRALTKLGVKRITSMSEDSKNARACTAVYDSCRQALLRDHDWSCAITRSSLAADSDAPIFGRAASFSLPSDFIRLSPVYPEDNNNDADWEIEGRKIYTDESAPISIRYIFDLTDVRDMDHLFREALAAYMAVELCQELLQSTSKKIDLKADMDFVLKQAKRANAIEKRVPQQAPEDSWITSRR